MKTEAESGVMVFPMPARHTKDCQKPQEARKRQGRILPRAFSENMALPTL